MKIMNMSKLSIGRSSIVTVVLGTLVQSIQAGTCTVDLSNTKQTIRGYGAATVEWQGTITSSMFDKGFGTTGGCGFTVCRIQAPATTTTYLWNNEIANGAAAQSRGAIVMASPWSPPAWMKNNNSTVGGYLLPEHYANYANHLNNFVTYSRNNGCWLHAISVQNEPDWDPDYVSCTWTADQLKNFCKNNMGIFYSTKVIMPESLGFNQALSDPALNDSTAAANIDIVGGHIYGGGTAAYPLAMSKGKELWMTEHLDNDTSISAVIGTGKEIHDCMNIGQYNAYITWYLKRNYGPIDEAGNRTKRGCVMAQYARWVRPGYVRVATTANPTSGIYVTAYKGSKTVIVAVNNSSTALAQYFSITGGSVGTMNRYRTSTNEDLATLSTISASSGSFWSYLPAMSVTTFVQQ